MKEDKIQSIQFTGTELDKLLLWLSELLLRGKECRARNKIVDMIRKKISDFEQERMKLVNKYAEKDEQNNLIIKTDKIVVDGKEREQQHYVFVGENRDNFNKEFQELESNTKFIFDILPSDKEDWEIVKNLILNLQKDFDYWEGTIYNEICKKFENDNENK